ncbi:MAG: mismatch repair protein MutS [Thermotogota bacterium]|nr:mismatch repair protein MutS [Thermotogota bacterium]MDK2863904.1 mismatch repair protein MutS [Thermotogota bacterium]
MNPRKLTPMMRQYLALKEEHKDSILLFRLGDFYEAFFDDAKTVSQELQIVLTQRNGVPMAGIPYHALDNYLKRLVDAGYKVAICDQMEDASQARGLVRREVTRIVTPGTVVEDGMLGEENNFALLLYPLGEDYAFSLCDVSTGEFYVGRLSRETLGDLLERGDIREILLPLEERTLGRELKKFYPSLYIDYLDDWFYDKSTAEEEIKKHYSLATLDPLELSKEEVWAAASMLRYLGFMQRSEVRHLALPVAFKKSDTMILDSSTVENLELVSSSSGKPVSLYHTLKNTRTQMGARLLKTWLVAPSLNRDTIEKRLDIVETFVNDRTLLAEIREYLGNVFDVERIVTRVNLGKASPKDLVGLRITLQMVPAIAEALQTNAKLVRLLESPDPCKELSNLLQLSISENPEGPVGSGGVIREGYSKELDEYRELLSGGEKVMREFEVKERMKTGIPNLKVGYNKVFGYYIEVSRSQVSKVPPEYERKQTLVNAERFVTPELKAYEEKVLSAQEKVEELEKTIFAEICAEVTRRTKQLRELARWLATIDVLASFAETALKHNYVRPVFSSEGKLELINSRHPVVERYVEQFIPNDLVLDKKNRFVILTGPNMSGKSTYLRQVGLIAIMAQIGSFVPADRAILPIFDRIFTRIGARDDVTSGKSTFLVEMSEVSTILNHATEKSLILLDEVGRGTATFDGISIAWAVSEYIHNVIKAYVIFATHFAELTELSRMYVGIVNKAVLVKETPQGVLFLHKVVDGAADKSYGVEVAKLAGIPEPVTKRASEILEIIESQSRLDKSLRILSNAEVQQIARTRKKHFGADQLRLFEEGE